MTNTENLIDQIASAVAQRVAIPLEIDLWDAKAIGAYLKVSPRQVLERYSCRPEFPHPIRLPSSDKGHGHPRWKAAEVIKWAESYSKIPAKPRKAA